MPITVGTAVSFTATDGKTIIGTVKGYENSKYRIEVDGNSIVEVEESKVVDLELRMATMSNKFGVDFGNILK
ncbi:hypothetical protein BJX63DRAFT_436064 [Aspergillus granulosus]|uniref:Hypervirulence associated protein TUDOR domain-containing protein n=1 Tax=Aspergillus granulosus TaxID=176169 RepID=A0ABR4H0X4_9EURO